jgi:hypothetical protein
MRPRRTIVTAAHIAEAALRVARHVQLDLVVLDG